MKNRFLLLCLLGCVYVFTLNGQEVFESELIVSELDNPIGIVHAGDERLFIIEQTGFIQIVSEGEVMDEPFLNVSDRINVDGFERGLLGLAFHPEYSSNGFFYINYTSLPDGNTVVSRFSVLEDNPNKADIESETVLLTVEQPFRNHNGGQLLFGPDEYLYIALGDGGSANDPENRAQNREVLLGKMLRIDVNTDDESEYAIPDDNPFVDDENSLDEIWAYGLRNPWRSSFDRYTGDFWIGDVGQGDREEINLQPSGSSGGENYGWRCFEGTMSFNDEDCLGDTAYVFPVFDYNHEGEGCTGSVVGGYVYRGAMYSGWFGSYFLADYCTGNMYRIDSVAGGYEGSLIGNIGAAEIASFGEDIYGELYYAKKGAGEIYKLVDPVDCEPVAVVMNGDSTRYLEQNDTTMLEAFYNPALEYKWFKDEVLMEGENEHILEVIEEGNYSVEVSNASKGCASISEPVEVAMLATNAELKELKMITVYPNPVKDILFIQGLPATRNVKVGLYDTRGALLHYESVSRTGNHTLNLAGFQAGTYYLRIGYGEEIFQQKVIK